MYLIREQFAAFEICHETAPKWQSIPRRNGPLAAIQTHGASLADSNTFTICYPLLLWVFPSTFPAAWLTDPD